MKYRLQLLKPTATTNDYGEEATTYEPIRTVWAERKKQIGNRSEEPFGELLSRFSLDDREYSRRYAEAK